MCCAALVIFEFIKKIYDSQVSLDLKVTLFLPFLLQNSKNAQGLVGLRNLGNTVSCSKQIIYSLIYSSYKNETSVKTHSPLCRCKLLSKGLQTMYAE